MTPRSLTLIGDGIENPHNALTMLHAAEMFGAGCVFLDRKGLQESWAQTFTRAEPYRGIDLDGLAADFTPRVALDNINGAEDIYGFGLPQGRSPAVMVGNERRGLSRSVVGLADCAVQIPMASRKLNTLNVAAADGVALYYLSRGGGGKMQTRSQPHKHRPELLLIGGKNHFELGSTIRSAGAFGWGRIFVEDRFGVWFGCDRVKKSEGRAAARRGRNPIRLIPTEADRRYVFEDVAVLTTRRQGEPLHRANLARGTKQVIVMADESEIDPDTEQFARLGRHVRFVRLDAPKAEAPYHFRLSATIALAEAGRQVGHRPPVPGRPRRHGPLFEHALKTLLSDEGETVFLEDLAEY